MPASDVFAVPPLTVVFTMPALVMPSIILTLTVPATPALPATPAVTRNDFISRVEEASTTKPLRLSVVLSILELIATVSSEIKALLISLSATPVLVAKASLLPNAVTLVLSSLSPPTVALVLPLI